MTKRYSILEKKLQEVESQLNEVISLPPKTPLHHLYTQDIDQRLDFLKTLLSAEVASSPQNPHHLHHIRKRLTEIETAFRERTTPHNPGDTVSNCSCTDSCLNDEYESLLEEDMTGPVEKANNNGLRREEKGVGVGVWGIIFTGGGLLFGMGLMGFLMLAFCQCFSHTHTPTPLCVIPT